MSESTALGDAAIERATAEVEITSLNRRLIKAEGRLRDLRARLVPPQDVGYTVEQLVTFLEGRAREMDFAQDRAEANQDALATVYKALRLSLALVATNAHGGLDALQMRDKAVQEIHRLHETNKDAVDLYKKNVDLTKENQKLKKVLKTLSSIISLSSK